MIGNKAKKKEDIFFDMFIGQIEKVQEASARFSALVNDYSDVNEKVRAMKNIESECDSIVHNILSELNGCFVTPFDREDIYAITRQIDCIVDSLEEVSNRFVVFGVDAVRPEALKMAELIRQAIDALKILFNHLKDVKKPLRVMEQVIEVNRIENEGDIVYRDALAHLFRTETDPIEIIKWKHLFEQMEGALDACEDVANIIEGVVMKYA